jgi:hypothetical protein
MINGGSGVSSRHLKMNKISYRVATIALAMMAANSSLVAPSFAAPPAKPADKAPAKPAEKPAEKPADKDKTATTKPEPVIENVQNVNAEQLVDKPHEYLNKNVKFVANFHGFTTLALDYKPALRPSKTYLSFLVFRENSKIPLSELKLAMAIPKEKDPDNTLLAQLKEGDQLEITGKVFNTALDEPWLDVLRLKKLKSAPSDDKDKKVAEEKENKDKKAGDTEPEVKGNNKPEKPEQK